MLTHDGKENDLNHVFELFHKGNGYTSLTRNNHADDECACGTKMMNKQIKAV